MRSFVRFRPLAVAVALILAFTASCDGCDDPDTPSGLPDLPPPTAPPLASCGEPTLTPITSVHEHVFDADRDIPTLLALADELGVQKVNLLPFWDDNVQEQNAAQAAAARENPERLSAFASLDPFDPKAIEHLERMLKAGATGVKMYSGYGRTFKEGALTGENAHRIYSYLEEHGLPLLMHTNGWRYEMKLREALEAHPKLVMLCPHYCLLSGKPGRLHALLNDFPNLYTDVSFGSPHILAAGMHRIGESAATIRAVIRTHRHRIAFGMDNVIDEGQKPDKLASVVQVYRDVLEKERFAFMGRELDGLHLDDCTLESIYRINPERFLAGKPPLKD